MLNTISADDPVTTRRVISSYGLELELVLEYLTIFLSDDLIIYVKY